MTLVMYALVDSQLTAIAGSGLCGDHFTQENAKAVAEGLSEPYLGWRDASGTEMTCTVCGRSSAALTPDDAPAREDFRQALVRLCQDYGFVTDHTYDLIESLIDSINTDPQGDTE